MSAPTVTVAVPCWRSERTIADCLRGLRSQTLADFEVRIVNSSPGDGTAAIVAAEMPWAVYVESHERLLPHAARNLALSGTSAEVLVSTDPDCVAEPDWLEQLTAPIGRGADLVVGGMGVVPTGRRGVAVHLCKYATYLPGLDPGRRRIAPSANLAMSRRLWERVGPFPGEQFVGDAILSWRAEEDFEPARFVPSATVRHRHDDEPFSFLRSRRDRGREFSAARMRHFGWSRARAGLHAAALPLLAVPPFLSGVVAAIRAGFGSAAARTLPLHFAGHLYWTLGEFEAYVERARARSDAR